MGTQLRQRGVLESAAGEGDDIHLIFCRCRPFALSYGGAEKTYNNIFQKTFPNRRGQGEYILTCSVLVNDNLSILPSLSTFYSTLTARTVPLEQDQLPVGIFRNTVSSPLWGGCFSPSYTQIGDKILCSSNLRYS